MQLMRSAAAAVHWMATLGLSVWVEARGGLDFFGHFGTPETNNSNFTELNYTTQTDTDLAPWRCVGPLDMLPWYCHAIAGSPSGWYLNVFEVTET